VTLRGDAQIGGLKITMYQVLPVGRCQALGELNAKAKSLRLGKGARAQHFVQADTRD